MTLITGQMKQDLIDYANEDYGDNFIDPEEVTKIVEDTYDLGMCDTCSYIITGFMVYYGDRERTFLDYPMPHILNWVQAEKPHMEYLWNKEDNPEELEAIVRNAPDIGYEVDCVEVSRDRDDPAALKAACIGVYYVNDEDTNHPYVDYLYAKDEEFKQWLTAVTPFVEAKEKEKHHSCS